MPTLKQQKVPQGMFIVSKAVGDKAELDNWVAHYKNLGIKTKVIFIKVKTKNHKFRNGKYFLAREGKEVVDPRTQVKREEKFL